MRGPRLGIFRVGIMFCKNHINIIHYVFSKRMSLTYPIQSNIQYSNNNEYRKCLRVVFQMNTINFPDTTTMDLDDETADEMMYDDKAANMMMDLVYDRTKSDPDFIVLYEKAASFMLSTDHNTGLSILFSYDYLDRFHSLLRILFSETQLFGISHSIEYITLYNKLHSK